VKITCDTTRTEERRQRLQEYMSTYVLAEPKRFICRHYRACRASHDGEFYKGQLHHLGRHYDLLVDGRPFRIVVVGQEYGGPPSCVTLARRYVDVAEESGLGKTLGQRNPHMRGTTHLLRLLFDIGLGSDRAGEYVDVDGEPRHLFDMFSLANYLLCSAHEGGTARGTSTAVMRANCQGHFRETLRILDPTVVVVQGKTFWRSDVQHVFTEVKAVAADVYRAGLGERSMLVVALNHPSVPSGAQGWGTVTPSQYLLQRVAPAAGTVRALALQTTAGG
jgi:hypothetical protein